MSVLPPGGNPVESDTDPKGDILPPGIVTDPNEAYLNAMRTIRLAADILVREGALPESFAGYVTPTQLAEQVAILQTWTMENFFLKAESGDLVLNIGDISGLQEALDAKLESAGFSVAMEDIDGLLTALGNKAPTGHGHDITDVSGLQTALDGIIAVNTAQNGRLDALEALPPGGGGGAWGDITGDIADQTDLNAILVSLDGRIDSLESSPAVPTTFLALTDTPTTYSSQSGKRLRVNTGANALEFFDDPMTVHVTIVGKPEAAELLIYMPMGFPAKMADGNYIGYARCKVAPTADAEFTIRMGNVAIGRVLFNTGQTTGIVNIYDDETFTATTLLVLEAPNPQDATLADIGISIPVLKGI